MIVDVHVDVHEGEKVFNIALHKKEIEFKKP